MKNKTLSILLMAALGLVAVSCGEKKAEKPALSIVEMTDTVPPTVNDLREAVRANDARRFASLVSYPLVRPYPLRDIHNEDQMAQYYPTLVDDSLRRVILNMPDSMWSSLGWRGWTLDNGKYLWVDEQLYAVPYISRVEKRQREDFERREMESLPKRYRKGWKPIGCMKSVSTPAVYRLDYNPKARAGQDYRMMVWNDSSKVAEEPTAVFIGRCNSEGTADVRTYFFASRNGAKAVYQGDVNSPDDQPRVLFTDPDGVNHADTVTSAYWLELLPPQN